MPTLPAPLFSRVYKNVNDVVLTDDAALQYNGFIDNLGGITVRPGEVLAINSALRNDGLYMWPDKNFIVSVDNGFARLRRALGTSLENLSGASAVTFTPGQIVIFCNDVNYVFMAGGGRINYINASGTVTQIADTDAPISVTHVAFLDGYILAINNNSKFYWSNIPTTTDWSALDFASAEANPDIVQALYVIQRQIFLLGTVTTEIWENDGETPFSRIPGGLIEIGCGAKYSPIRHGNSLIWLTDGRQFCKFTGTDVKFISSRYDKEISTFTTVSDCIGAFIFKDGIEYYVFQFPTQNRTLVYNPGIDDWSEWGIWDESAMLWYAYDIRASVRDLGSGQTYIGKGAAQVITCLSSTSRVDFTGPVVTKPVKFLRRTGFIDYGTGKKKRNEELRFRVSRGGPTAPTDPKLMIRYRNNGSSQWSNIKEIDLGNIGQTEHHSKFNRTGVYKSRQYEISCTDNVPLTMASAEEEVTILR